MCEHAQCKFEKLEVQQYPARPPLYAKLGTRIFIESHMDDFHGCGRLPEVTPLLPKLREQFRLKASDVVLDGSYAHLKRTRWKLQDETIIAAIPKHQLNVIKALGLEGADGVTTPHLPDDRPESSTPLDDERAATVLVEGAASVLHQRDAAVHRRHGIVDNLLSAPILAADGRCGRG